MDQQHSPNSMTEYRIAELEKRVKSLIDERDRAMRWGIIALGTAVIAMGSWIFNYIVSHIK